MPIISLIIKGKQGYYYTVGIYSSIFGESEYFQVPILLETSYYSYWK